MLPAFLIPALIGGGLGAITNRKNPMQGALLGAALGGVGGQFAPGLLNAGNATAGVAQGAATEASGGLLGAETGLNSAGYLAPEMGGAITEQAAAPVVNMNTQAGLMDKANYAMGNTFSQGGTGAKYLDAANKLSKPVGTAVQVAQAATPQEQPMQSPSIVPPTASPALSQIAQANTNESMQRQQVEQMKREMRRKQIGLLGGY